MGGESSLCPPTEPVSQKDIDEQIIEVKIVRDRFTRVYRPEDSLQRRKKSKHIHAFGKAKETV
jgi:hypothetical protein